MKVFPTHFLLLFQLEPVLEGAADLLWARLTMDTEYFDDMITVFGHTPTLYLSGEHRGKVIKTRTWIDIDTGCSQGFPPALLRLDDLEVFYGLPVENS